MARSRPLARLYCELPLAEGKSANLVGSQAHYVRNVLRAKSDEQLQLFNDRDGEWRARIEDLANAGGIAVRCLERSACPDMLPDVWLLFAPLKKAPTDYVVEKATELGVSRILPVTTRYSNTRRISVSRLTNVAIEATQQCGGIAVPRVEPVQTLKSVLTRWPSDRALFHCDETVLSWSRAGPHAGTKQRKAVLVGPEGGFSPDERDLLRSLDFVAPLALGTRILRAETAAVVALAIVHSSAIGKD